MIWAKAQRLFCHHTISSGNSGCPDQVVVLHVLNPVCLAPEHSAMHIAGPRALSLKLVCRWCSAGCPGVGPSSFGA